MIEFVVADRAGCVSNLIHRLDCRRSFEIVAKERAGEDIPGIEDQVRLHTSNDRRHFRHTADAISGKDLAMNIIRMGDDNVDRRLGGDPETREWADDGEEYNKLKKRLPHTSIITNWTFSEFRTEGIQVMKMIDVPKTAQALNKLLR